MKIENMRLPKISARAKFRQQQERRIQSSAPLAESFPTLKALSLELSFFPANGVVRSSQIKYTVNLDHAKSVFCFDCTNKECIRGDFDLSAILAEAVSARQKLVMGEMRCNGWRDKDSVRKTYCHNLLRYKLTLELKRRANGSA